MKRPASAMRTAETPEAALTHFTESRIARTVRAFPGIVLVAVTASVLALTSTNPALTMLAILVLAVLAALLWRPGEPPILLLVAGLQWLQVSTKIFHADLLGIGVEDLHWFQGYVEMAIVLSLLALATLAAGMFTGQRRRQSPDPELAVLQARTYSVRKLWWGYLAFSALHYALVALAWVEPRITQILLAMASMKIVFIVALAYAAWASGRGYQYLTAALLLELLLGFSGFFAEFKTVLLVLAVISFAALRNAPRRRLVALSVLVSLGLSLSVVWTAVKGDYREFISGGTAEQVAVVPWAERMEELAMSVGRLEAGDLAEAVTRLAQRVAYVDFFAATLAHVPEYEEHAYGALTAATLLHLLTPRLLFPDKPALSDNENVLRYAGVQIAESGSGTSIGLGYLAELYVDFGVLGMFVAVFGLGYLAGWIYGFLVSNEGLPLFANYGLALMVLFPMSAFETALVKIVGGVTMVFLVSALMQRFILPDLLNWFRTPVPSHVR